MVAPIRKVVNKHFSFSSASITNSTMASIPSNIEIDVDIDMNREYLALSSKNSLRSLFISLSTSSVLYHQHMEINNNLPEEISTEPINSFQLSYIRQAKENRLVRLATDKELASNSQHVCNKMPALKKAPEPHSKGKDKQIERTNPIPSENMLNIQLLYDKN